MSQKKLELEILPMPSSVVSTRSDGGWGIFMPSGNAKFEVGWISPPIAGRYHLNVSIMPELQSILGYDAGELLEQFNSFEEAVDAAKAFLDSKRKQE